jgi:uncharacterized membrane protein
LPAADPAKSRRLHHGAFGNDRYGVTAERFARYFGTPRFIIGQIVLVGLWITEEIAGSPPSSTLQSAPSETDTARSRSG